jgi:hypothetical protein
MRPAVKRRLVTLAAAASLVLMSVLGCAHGDRKPSQEVELNSPATSTPVEKPAQHRWAMKGVIVDKEGKTVAGLPLILRKSVPVGSGPAPVAARTATALDGTFTFRDLPLEHYYIVVGGSDRVGWVYLPVPFRDERDVDLGTVTLARPN